MSMRPARPTRPPCRALSDAVRPEAWRMLRAGRRRPDAHAQVPGISPAALIESLEARRMLTVTPTLSTPSPQQEGSPVVIDLSASASANSHGLTGWKFEWGDGAVDLLPADATQASHVYDEPSGFGYNETHGYCITATASDDGADGPADASQTMEADVSEADPWVGGCGAGAVDEGSVYTLYPGFCDPGGDGVDEWLVDWCDGSPTESFAPDAGGAFAPFTHVYWEPDEKWIFFTAVSEDGCFCASMPLEVDEATPSVNLAGTGELPEGSAYTLSANFDDPGGDDVSGWQIDWGDGTYESFAAAGNPATFSHTYSDPGGYTATATAVSEDGSFSGSTNLAVDEAPISVGLYGPPSVDPDAAFSVYTSFCDPGGDAVWGWQVEWGDGTNETLAGDPGSFTHAYSQSGQFTITATAFSADGANSGSMVVSVNDVPASAWACGSTDALDEGSAYTLYAGFADPLGHPAENYCVAWGDGSLENFPVGPGPGDPDSNAGAFQHTYSEPGCYTVSVNIGFQRGGAVADTSVEVGEAAPSLWANTDAPQACDPNRPTDPNDPNDPQDIGSDLYEGSTYDFFAAFCDPAGDHVDQWLLEWGDGSSETFCGSGDGGVGDFPTFSHVYLEPAFYNPVATAFTEDGSYADPASVVHVIEAPASVYVYGSDTADEGTPYLLFGGFCDPGNDPVFGWHVEWGDGSSDDYTTPGGAPCSSFSHTYSEPGSYSATVTALTEDDGGFSNTFDLTIDGPAAPIDLAVQGTTDTTALLTWAAPVTGPAIAGYQVLRAGQIVDTTSSPGETAFQDTGLTPATAYTYTVLSLDATDHSSPPTDPVTATTTSPAFDSTPPSTPAGLSAVGTTDDSVSLTWPASSDNVAVTGYELDMEATPGDPQTAFVVGQSSAPPGPFGLTVEGLSPGTPYTFLVKAFDAMGNSSVSAPFTTSTAADQTDPTVPTDLVASANTGSSITLSWTAASDNVGVTGYNVYRWAVPVPLSPGTVPDFTLLTPTPVPDTSFPDANVTPGTTYQYQVSANDGTDHESGRATLQIVAATPASTDAAPDQYIPPQWQDYFYDQLTPALRQRDVMTGTTPQPARGWLDPGSDTVIVAGPSGGAVGALSVANDVYFYDRNGNNQYDQGETAWVGPLGQTFDQYQAGEPMLCGAAPPNGTPGMTGVWYQDLNQNHQRDPGEALLQNVYLMQGVRPSADPQAAQGAAGQLAYRDLAGVGHWVAGDPIWCDSNGNSLYDAGETVVYSGSAALQAADLGKEQGLCYYDPARAGSAGGSAGAGGWQPSDTLIWVDNTSFRQDFGGFYTALEALVPKFGRADAGGVYPNDLQSVGTILQSLGVPTQTLVGTVSVDASTQTGAVAQGTSTVTGSGTDFAHAILPGDSVLLNGNWYPVSSVNVSGSAQHLTLGQPYFGPALSGAPLTVINWTLVPAEASVEGEPGLSFVFQRGRPTSTSVVFPQQFTELQGVLNALTQLPQRYDVALYDADSSQAFITAATAAFNDYQSLFGPLPDTAVGAQQTTAAQLLRDLLLAGGADPGSINKADNVALLEQVTDTVAAAVYVRDLTSETSGLSNGWKMGSPQVNPPNQTPGSPYNYNAPEDINDAFARPHLTPGQPVAWQLGPPDTFNSPDEKQSLLPQIPAPAGSPAGAPPARAAGAWSTFAAHTAVLPVHVSEVSGFLSAVNANGLWVAMGRGTDVTAARHDEVDEAQTFDGTPGKQAPAWPAVPGADGWPADDPGFGAFGDNPDAFPGLPYDYVTGDVADYIYAYQGGTAGVLTVRHSGAAVTVTLPSAANALGGSDVTTLATGPDGYGVNASGWAWGGTATLANISDADAKAAMVAHLTPATLSGADSASSNDLASGLHWWWWAGSEQSVDFDGNVNGGGQIVRVYLATANPSLFGLVPAGTTFSYTAPRPAAAPPPAAGNAPAIPIAPATAMDRLNVVPDTNADDIVSVDQDLTSLGNDSGSIAFQADRDLPQVYLPVYTLGGTALPVHAYLVQGGFGASATAIGSLGSTAWTSPDISAKGVPYAFSLDARVHVSVLVNQGGNHVKRIEVVRPRGNAVVFDFPWDSTANQFSPVGIPNDYGQRDNQQLYVLRDLTPQDDTDFSYAMLFPSGVRHVFNAGTGYIQSVKDADGLSTDVTAGLFPNQPGQQQTAGTIDTGPFPTNPITADPRYNVTLSWSNGGLDHVTYAAKSGGETFTTKPTLVAPNPGDMPAITVLDKSAAGPIAAASIPDFSYQLLDPQTIGNNGATIKRTGTVAAGSATITTTLPGVNGSTEETWAFNANRLVTSDVRALTEPTGSPTAAVTTYDYAPGQNRLPGNGTAVWGELTGVTYPDQSWETFAYDPSTGWPVTATTPFKNGQPTSGPTGTVAQALSYTDASGAGAVADTTQLVERPRKVVTTTAGVVTDIAFNQFKNSTHSFVTRHALSLSNPAATTVAAWMAAGFPVTTTISAYASYTVQAPTATVAVSDTPTSSAQSVSFFSTPIASSSAAFNAFGVLASSSSSAAGSAQTGVTAGQPDALGRAQTATAVGGATSTLANYTWEGPQTVTGPDGTVSSYTYTPWGQVKTVTVGTATTTFNYDAAGNVVATATVGAAPPGGTALTTHTSASWDVLGRPKTSTDEMNRTTAYDYSSSAHSGTTVNTYNPDGTSETDTYYLDGTLASVAGTAVTANPMPAGTPSPAPAAMSYDEGVNSNGDYWSLAVQGGILAGPNWTKTYTDHLGEQYKTETSTDTGTAAATTAFDGSLRPIKDVAIDGSITRTDYDPVTGLVKDTWLDANADGTFTPGIDTKSVYDYSPASSAAGTTKTTVFSTTGNSTDTVTVSNGGMDSSETADGLTTTSHTDLSNSGETDTTTNPDGTKDVETYTQGLLRTARVLGTNGQPVTSQGYGYDTLLRNNSVTDWTGTTTYTLRDDGSVSAVAYPDGRTSSVTATLPNTNAPTAAQRTDGATVTSGYNSLYEPTKQDGAGVVPATFGYDQTTGDLTRLSTFASGNIASGTPATTTWDYSGSTGLLKSKTYNDQSQYTWNYDGKLRLSSAAGPGGLSVNSPVYNQAGELDSLTTTDPSGSITDAVKKRDDLGRPVISTETARNPAPAGAAAPGTANAGANLTTTSTQHYTPQGQLQSDTSGPSGATTVYTYFPNSGQGSTGGGASPGALHSVKLVAGQTTLAETDYAYDGVTGRLQTVTVVGLNGAPSRVYTVSYKPNTDLVQSVAGPGATTTLGYDGQNGRLTSIGAVNTANGTLYSQQIQDYYANDQRKTESGSRLNSGGGTEQYSATYTYDGRDELASVASTGSGGPTPGSWTYDAVGNRQNFAGGTDPHGMNQYASYHYNARGDLQDEGTNGPRFYTWDAQDRLTSITAVQGGARTRVTFSYDAQGRLAERDTYTFTNGSWASTGPTGVTRYAWDGMDLMAEFDGNDQLQRSYAWGPTGLLGVTDYASGSPVTYSVIQDATGSVVQLVDSTGAVSADYHYDAWGNCTASGPAASACPFRFAGMYQDAATGLYYDHARFYSATQGRFLSRDPAGEDGGLNLYAYCQNDPVNNLDPTGLDDWKHVSAEQVWQETFDEVHGKYPDAKNLSDCVHPNWPLSSWYSTKLQDELVKIYEKKCAIYQYELHCIVDLPPAPATPDSIGPGKYKSPAELYAEENVKRVADFIAAGEPVPPEMAELALVRLQSEQDGSGNWGVAKWVLVNHGMDLIMAGTTAASVYKASRAAPAVARPAPPAVRLAPSPQSAAVARMIEAYDAKQAAVPTGNDTLRLRSTYQGGPYPAGRFGRAGPLWQNDPVYRSGQVRTERIVHEAGRKLQVDVNKLVDEILFVPGAKAPFFVEQDGRTIVGMNDRAVNGADPSLRLLKAAHELGHAKVFANPALSGALSYEEEEILVESEARAALAGSLSRRARRNSVQYENDFRALVGQAPLPVPP